MSNFKESLIKVGGKKGMIIHDRFCADGPVDPITKEPLIDPKTGQPYPGKNDDMSDLLHEYLVILRGNTMIDELDMMAPRFGVISLIAMHTPIFVYDHPRLKKVANTAFTDGIHVFVCADFMRKMVEQEEAGNGKETGVMFVLIHELMHKLYYHVDRLKNFDHKIANIAEDYVINGKIVKGYKLEPIKLLLENLYGVKPEEAEKYYKMAEEVVAEMLTIQERKKQKEEKEKQKNKQQKQQGSGQGGDDDNQDQESGEGNEKSDKKKDKGDKDSKKEKGDDNQEDYDYENENGNDGEELSPIHHITPEELIDILEEEGLHDTVGKALNLPKSDDVDGIGKMKQTAKLNDVDAIQTAISQANKAEGKYPGQHIAEEAASLIGGLEKGKLSWKLAIRKHFLGDGLKLRDTDDEAAIPWYLSKESMGVDPFYMGALVPQAPDEAVLCLIDTSGSTSGNRQREEYLGEALTLQKGVSTSGDTAREVILMSADTVLRGEPIIINEYNVGKLLQEGVPVFGDGGTSFVNCLKQAMDSKIMKKKKVKSVIYFTDCCDFPPRRADFEEYINKGIRIVFITTTGMYNEKWNKDVSSFAEVYCIEENTQVNLDKKDGNYEENTRKNKFK